MTPLALARKIDHTILKPEARAPEVQKVVAEALRYQFASVCLPPAYVEPAARQLKGSQVKCCTVIGFPHGTNKPTIKAIEATSCVKDGADEIDIVVFLPFMLNQDWESARDELIQIVRAARAVRPDVVIKAIVESACLLKDRTDPEPYMEHVCQVVRQSGCDFIKTSTGYHPAGGASVRAVSLMRRFGGTDLQVKASGGIRDLKTALAMIEAGADRLGMSASVSVIEELKGGSAGTAGGY